MAEVFFARQPSPSEIRRRVEGFQSWLEVDLDAITTNIERTRAKVGVELIPCVKTNAYGHGIVPVVAHMMTCGVKTFLVAKLWEAETLRDAGLDCGVVCMDPLFTDEQFETVVSRNITHTVYSLDVAEQLSRAGKKLGKKALVWIKLDTGLGRVGVRWTDAAEFVKKVAKVPNVEITGLFSTLSEEAEFDKVQVERMKEVSATLDKLGIKYGVRSMASSNAVFHREFSYLDAVRPGLMLYGLYPEPEDRGQGIELVQSFRFMARIEQVKTVESGETLTYSRRFTAPRRMRVGTCHIGYSDGYPRGLTKKGLVRVEGKIKNVLGTVSVNHILVDLDGTDAKVGDAIEAIGKEGENAANRVADEAGIMIYSLMVAFSPLTPRVYTRGGVPVALSEPFLTER